MERQIGEPDGNLVLDLFVLHQRVGDLMEATLDGTGVRPTEFAIYSQLGIAPMTPRRLTARLGAPASTLTGHLATLERRGHTRRRSNPADGRSYEVELTEQGRRVLQACQMRFRSMLDQLDAAVEVDVTEARTLLAHLDRIAAQVAERLEQAGNDERSGSV